MRRLSLATLLAALLLPVSAGAQSAGMSPEDFGKLIEALRGEPQRPLKVRLQAALIMGRAGGAQALPALIECLDQDEEYPVRGACALALGNLGDVRAVEPLVAHLDDPEALVRDESHRSLMKVAVPDALPYLQAAREQGSLRVRLVLVEVAGAIKSAEAGALLAELLGDADERVRAQAGQTLQGMPADAAQTALLKGLEHPNYRVKATCASQLGARQAVAAIPALADLVMAPLEAMEVQTAAREALRQMRGALELPKLVAQARDATLARAERSRALMVLSAAGGAEALRPLLDGLQDADESIRASAAQALAELGDGRALPALRDAQARTGNERIGRVIGISIRRLERSGGR